MDHWLNLWALLLEDDAWVTLCALAAIALLTLFELAIPAEPGQGWRGRLRNLAYLVLLKGLGLAGVAAWYMLGPRFEVTPIDPGPLAQVGLVAANLLAIDFVYYFYHRAQHRFRFLWAIHELHHADAELNATSSYRTYWLEAPVQMILVLTPTLLLFGGVGPTHGLIVLGFSLFFLIFSHANLRLRLGPLSGWVIGPQVHRIHHSRLPGHRDRNFAQYFPFLDRLFGSYYAPGRDEFPPTGADELASDAAIATAMLRPFRIWTGLAPRRSETG